MKLFFFLDWRSDFKGIDNLHTSRYLIRNPNINTYITVTRQAAIPKICPTAKKIQTETPIPIIPSPFPLEI